MGEFKVSIKDGVLVVEIPVASEMHPSASGKNLIVASTHGPARTSVDVNGKPLMVNLNAYIKNG